MSKIWSVLCKDGDGHVGPKMAPVLLEQIGELKELGDVMRRVFPRLDHELIGQIVFSNGSESRGILCWNGRLVVITNLILRQ